MPSHFISLVKNYYSNDNEESTATSGHAPAIEPQATDSNIDRRFLERVWRWLIQNPEIRLGRHGGHGHLTLSEVEAHNAAVKSSKNSSAVHTQSTEITHNVSLKASQGAVDLDHAEASQTAEDADASKPFDLPSTPHETNLGTVGQHDTHTRVPEKERRLEKSRKSGDTQVDNLRVHHEPEIQLASETDGHQIPAQNGKSNSTLRLYTSEDRMWRALAGHGPDFTKIKALDFACLSIIGTRGKTGIYQHDLVQISGQDKRSLPARTDRLHNTGYITKKRVCAQVGNPKRSLNTSHLVLKCFTEGSCSRRGNSDEAESSLEKSAEDESGRRSLLNATPDEGRAKSEEPNISLNRPIPQWTRERPLSNQIFDLVFQSGTRGMTMRVRHKSSFISLETNGVYRI